VASSGSPFAALPRPLRWLGLAVAAFVLTGFFAVLRFPYDRLATTLSDQSESLTGIRLVLSDLSPSLWPGSMGLVATEVRAVLPRGETVVLPSVRVRPAVSLSWLLGAPSLYVDVRGGGLGTVEGELTLGSGAAFDGSLRGVNLALLPLDQLAPGLGLDGVVDGDIDVANDAEGHPSGHVGFEAARGSFAANGLPVAVPFDSFVGDLRLGGEHFARIEKLELRGPMLDATATGTVGRAAVRGSEPLAVELDLLAKGNGIQPVLQQLGVPVGRGGRSRLQVTGTLARPTFR